jgi:hypothetical protein
MRRYLGTDEMLTIYGKKYAKNDAEFTSTLFDPSGTANGFYRRTEKGIYFSDMQGNVRTFVRADGLGPVSVSKESGRMRYMFSHTDSDARWMSIPESYMQACYGAKECVKA